MRCAIIDLGTNTFNLLIADMNGHGAKRVFDTKRAVKLGEGGINRKFIQENAFKRGIEALKEYSGIIQDYKCDRIKAIATSAIRNADNGIRFAEAALRETGIEITIIDGNREAELIYHGVKQALDLGNEPVLVMDIGGGSTEFIVADNQKILWKQSFELGAARLLDQFSPSEPIKQSEIELLEKHFHERLKPLSEALSKYNVDTLVGSSGSFDSLAEIIVNRYRNMEWPKELTTYNFELNELKELFKLIFASNREQRLKIKGLVEMRVDMIVISSVFVQWIINTYHLRHIKLSTYSLKEGVVHFIAKGQL